jgi:hypothetical protein
MSESSEPPRVGPEYDQYVANQIDRKLPYSDYASVAWLVFSMTLVTAIVVVAAIGLIIVSNGWALLVIGLFVSPFAWAWFSRWNDVRKVKALADAYRVEAALE